MYFFITAQSPHNLEVFSRKSVFWILLKCYLEAQWEENSRTFCVWSTGNGWNNRRRNDLTFEVLQRVITSPSLERKIPVREIIFKWTGLSHTWVNSALPDVEGYLQRERKAKARENYFHPRIPNPVKCPTRGGQKTTMANHMRTQKISLPRTISGKATEKYTPPKWGPNPRKRKTKEAPGAGDSSRLTPS